MGLPGVDASAERYKWARASLNTSAGRRSLLHPSTQTWESLPGMHYAAFTHFPVEMNTIFGLWRMYKLTDEAWWGSDFLAQGTLCCVSPGFSMWLFFGHTLNVWAGRRIAMNVQIGN